MTTAVDLSALQEDVERHIKEADAEYGVWIRHVQSGEGVSVNPDALYLMASVFKVPILVEALAQVDEGKLRLEDRTELRWEDQLSTSYILGNMDPGLRPTLRDLLTAMITVSDNTATDMVLRQVGAQNVMARLRSWGIENMAVHTGVQGLFEGATTWPDSAGTMPAVYREVLAAGPVIDPFTGVINEKLAASMSRGMNWDSPAAQRTLENNVASPRAIGTLLERLVKGELLSRKSTGVALDIMLRQNLNQRMPKYIPQNVPVAHKTGTFFGSRNDAGILYLPDGARVVVAVFTAMKRERLDLDPLESVPYTDGVDSGIGRIARSALDAFMPNASA
jgi:beta-lactamase class A